MTIQSQYNYFVKLLVAGAILASVAAFLCAWGMGELVMWVAPDVGSGAKQAFIDSTKTGKAHALNCLLLSDQPVAG